MPRGRHRHSPPLHRLLPPSAIAGVSIVCAVGPWLFTEPLVLRGLAAAAAVTAVIGAVVMRRWDAAAGKRVADLTRARASDEWRHEERVAELESDLDESRELRTKLERNLRAKRAELAGLRNEHAALLRRYATAETERASALEGRRQLAIEAAVPARAALPAGPTVPPDPEPPAAAASPEAPEVPEAPKGGAGEASVAPSESSDVATDAPASPKTFSPAGSSLFLRANAALNRIASGAAVVENPAPGESADAGPAQAASVNGASPEGRSAETGPSSDAVAEEGEAQGKPEAADGHTRAAAEAKLPEPSLPSQPPAQSSASPQASTPVKPSGHFAVPTAVAVVPATPVRRPKVEGGFDFFGTQKASSADALQAVQNEDLADVVGQEALALHKADAEAGFKPVDDGARGIGQVIDLTAHDETEPIDVGVLRGAAS
ncbi:MULTISPECIES: hypothetical protein [Streptomyces]|uniref:Secreted protein n=1 Tax=Streptomyces dengpaensis TaxID=2049881 RepID=A0ABM6SRP4_9ACTN|nr:MULTISPECIES: hypothetical protein [Streptomyces]AVH57319.1 hypothetical protein C4B68_17770 [Streptomyces dengpaensis]PIB05334.1 hypothetical protein B1C81_28805 [Streptomyces sp. HG99]